MKPIGPLMWEHRRIERMIALIAGEIERLEKGGAVNVAFIESAVDFIRTYADHTHHGKEEDILFKQLATKNLTPEHKITLEELIEEHKYGRNTVSRLVVAKESFTKGYPKAVEDVIAVLKELVVFYPKHIAKEDTNFFLPVLDYFTEHEQQQMLKEFNEFDQNLIHAKYEEIIQRLEKK